MNEKRSIKQRLQDVAEETGFRYDRLEGGRLIYIHTETGKELQVLDNPDLNDKVMSVYAAKFRREAGADTPSLSMSIVSYLTKKRLSARKYCQRFLKL